MKRPRLFLSPIVHLLWLLLPVFVVVPAPVSAGAAAVVVTATKDDGVPAATRKLGGNTVTYTNTITNTGGIDATGVQFLDPDVAHAGYVLNSLKATPVALNDTYPSTVIANTSINTATSGFSVITNDFGGFSAGVAVANTALTISAFDAASTGGGTVSMVASGANVGQFTYTPAAGFTGTDTFTYTVSNGVAGGTAASIKATVSIVVGGPVVWFVDPNSATNGNGTLGSPFNVLSSALTAIGANVNQRIFIYSIGSFLTVNIPLNAGGWLVGQAAVGASFDAVMGVTYPADTASRPAINNLTKPAITRAFGSTVTLGNGSNVFGVRIDASGTATALSGAVNTATVGNAAASDVLINNTGSGAVNLGAGNGSIAINADIISGGAGTGVTVASRTGGTVTFSRNLSVNSGAGIALSNNTGATINFTGGMGVNSGANAAFSATGGGTVSATQNNTSIINTLTTTTGTALNVANTTIGAGGLTFQKISTNGGTNGIVLNTTGAGGFTVSGDGGGANNGSGGTVQNATGVGISLTTTGPVSLGYINVTSSGTDGIKATSVNGFTLNRSNVSDTANGSATDAGVKLINITGGVAFTDDSITGSTHNGIEIDNFNTNMASFTMTGTTINGSLATALGNDGILLQMRGTSVLPSGVISGCTFLGMRAVAVQIQANDSGRIGVNSGAASTTTLTGANSFVVQGNTFTGNGQGVDIDSSQISNVTFQVLTNTVVGKVTVPNAIANTASSNAITCFTAAGADTGPTTHSFVGKIDGNIIGTQGVKDSGSGFGSGVRAVIQGQGTQGIVTISNNTIREVPNATIINIFGQNGNATNSTASAFARFKVTNNTMPAISGSNLSLGGPANTPIADTGIFVLADEGFPNSAVITGNTIYDVTTASGSFDIYLAVRTGPPAGAQLKIEGTGSVSAFTLANNTLAGANKFVDEGAGSGTPSTLVAPGSQGTYPLLFAQGGVEKAAESANVPRSAGTVPWSAGTAPWSAVASEARHRLGNALPVRSRTASVPPAEPSEGGVALSLPAALQGAAAPAVLAQEQLDGVVAAALARWEASGLTGEQVARLRSLKFEVTVLSNNHLGEAGSDAIRVDRDAGGNGWFAEASAQSDALFGAAKSATRHYTDPAGAPAGRVDLLTTILHEMGHALGLADTYLPQDRDSIMFGQLTKGERRLPANGQAVGATPFAGDITHFLSGGLNPITIGTLPVGKSVIITYDVQIENPITPNTTSQLSSQATIHSTTASFVDFTTADIEGAALTGSGPTVTLLAIPPSAFSAQTPPATGDVGLAYVSYNFVANGIPAPTYSVQSGTLPGGLSLNAAGLLSGTPTTAGTFSGIVIRATNVAGTLDTLSFTITIAPTVTVTPATLPDWTVNAAGYTQTVVGNNGTGAKTLALTAGAIPTGMTFTAATGVLNGTPTAAGTFNFTITATDTLGQAIPKAYTVVINAAITVSPASVPNWTVNKSGYTQTITNTGGTGASTFAVTVGAVPTGLTLSAGGVLSGTPTAAGTFNFTVTATDTVGATGAQAYTVIINAAIAVSPATLPNGQINAAYSQTVTASGGTGAKTFSFTGTLPTGVSLSAAGAFSGTATAAGTFNFTVFATDTVGATGSQAYSVVISAITITPSTLPDWTVNKTGYSQTLTGGGGTGPYTFAVTAGTLPTGLTLVAGVLSGTPTVANTFNFTITVTDNVSTTGSQAYTVVIAPAVAITTATLPNWTANKSGYTQTIAKTGGTGASTFSVSAGTVPTGLTLSAGGVLSGTPTIANTFNFTITATDTVGATASQAYTVVIAPAIVVSPATLPNGLVSQAYSQTITNTGGTGAVTFSVSSGTIPNGLTLTPGGLLSGTPTTANTFNFTITATDTVGATGSQAYTIIILAPITYTVTTTGNAIVVTDTGGVPDTLVVSEPSAGNIQFDVAGKTFTVDGGVPMGGSSGVLSRTGVTQITLDAGTGADNVTVGAFTGTLPNVTIGSAANKFGTVTFTGAFTLGAANTLTADASGTLSTTAPGIIAAGGNITLSAGSDLLISGNINHPAGADATLTLRANNNIDINSSAGVTSTSNKLHVVLNSNRDAVGTGAIFLRSGTVINSNGGDITLGGGANPLTTMAIGNATLPNGILIDGATLSAGAGAINLRGQGASFATAAFNSGVDLEGSALVQTTTGNITSVTQGGTLGTGSYGFRVAGGQVTTADGSVGITGTAGSASGNAGGFQAQTGAVALLATGLGTITVTGTGGTASGTFDVGVQLAGNTAIQVASGAMVITGTATSGNNSGVRLSTSSSGRLLSTDAGSITITGTGFGTGFGFQAGASSIVGGASATGNITINADKIDLTSGTPSVQTTATVGLRQKTFGQPINVGAADSGAQLGLTDAELNRITAPTVQIGDASSGPISVSAVISPLNYKTLAFGNNTTFAASGGFASEIGPTAVDIEKISVTGTFNILAGATLTMSAKGGFVPVAGQNFQMVTNDLVDAVTGNFVGLAEGTPLPNFLGSTITAQFTYLGGTGNDAVVTTNRPPVPGVVSAERHPTQSVKIPVATITGAATDPDAGDTISLVSVGNGPNGTAQILGGFVLYQPTSFFESTHSFSYVIQDNHGAQANGNVTVTVKVDNALSMNISKISVRGDGSVAVDFAGIPGFTYGLQYTPTLADPVTWTTLGPVTADQFGAGHAVDGPPPTGMTSGFYRLVYPYEPPILN